MWRWMCGLAGIMLAVVGGWLWWVQPDPADCATVLLTTNRQETLSAGWSDGPATWPLLANTTLIDQSPSWLVVEHATTLWKVRPDGSHAHPISRQPVLEPMWLGWEPDQRHYWLATLHDSLEVYRGDIHSGSLQHVWGIASRHAVIAYDNPFLYRVQDETSGRVDWYLLNPQTGQARLLTPNIDGASSRYFALAPDNRHLLYSQTSGKQTTLYLATVGADDARPIWSLDGEVREIVWHPKATGVVLHIAADPTPQVVWVDALTAQVTPLAHDTNALQISGWVDSTRLLVHWADGVTAARYGLLDVQHGSATWLDGPAVQWVPIVGEYGRLGAMTVSEGSTHLDLYDISRATYQPLADLPEAIRVIFPLPCPDSYRVGGMQTLYTVEGGQVVGARAYANERWIQATPPHDWHPLVWVISGVAVMVTRWLWGIMRPLTRT